MQTAVPPFPGGWGRSFLERDVGFIALLVILRAISLSLGSFSSHL